MTDRNQEVIETIAEILDEVFDKGGSFVRGDKWSEICAEALLDRIAPLIRGEFPEGVIEKIIRRIYLKGRRSVDIAGSWAVDVSEEITEFKRLFEGQPKVGDNKGTCQTCMGNKGWMIYPPRDAGETAQPYWRPCPRCNSGVEWRSGEERRKIPVFDCCLARRSIKLKLGEEITIKGTEFEDDVFMFRDRRTLKDRRKNDPPT